MIERFITAVVSTRLECLSNSFCSGRYQCYKISIWRHWGNKIQQVRSRHWQVTSQSTSRNDCTRRHEADSSICLFCCLTSQIKHEQTSMLVWHSTVHDTGTTPGCDITNRKPAPFLSSLSSRVHPAIWVSRLVRKPADLSAHSLPENMQESPTSTLFQFVHQIPASPVIHQTSHYAILSPKLE